MGREREKPVDPFVQFLMDKHNCSSLGELVAKRKLDPDFTRHLANGRKSNVLQKHLEESRKAGMTLDEWAQKLLAS